MTAASRTLQDRTKAFALAVLASAAGLPSTDAFYVVRRQLMRAATSVAANYRAASRSRSRAEFIAKLHIVKEEADECLFWIELIDALGEAPERWHPVRREASELLAIVLASLRTARKNHVR